MVYLALPRISKGSPILVLHAWWGLNNTIKTFCGWLAQEGFVAFAADLYHCKIAKTDSQAEALRDALDDETAKQEILHAVKFLEKRAGKSGVTVIGFSLGASYALDLSTHATDSIRSVVIFYGLGSPDLNFRNSNAKYLGHFAAYDRIYAPKVAVDKLEKVLKDARRPVTFHTYRNTRHHFFERDRREYNYPAARAAYDSTVAFLNR